MARIDRIIWVGLALSACTSDSGIISLGLSDFANEYSVVVVDTFSVEASTILLDSIPTSGTGTLLIGGYTDAYFGRTVAEAYAQVGVGDTWKPSDEARFDSLVLVVNYSGYYYGDTTEEQHLSVHRVVEDFKTYELPRFWVDEGLYSTLYSSSSQYNGTTIQYDREGLGSRRVRLRPQSRDSITIRLDDALGQELLRLARSQSETITDQTQFLDYFKGIRLASESATPNAVVGLSTDSLRLRLYYEQYLKDGYKAYVQTFPFTTGLSNYSRIYGDRENTPITNLTVDQPLSASALGGECFVQAGTGVITKVSFPHVLKLVDQKKVLIVNQAQLVIQPIEHSYSGQYPLPRELTLYETDKSNLPIRQLTADYNSDVGQSAAIGFDEEFGISTGYVFTITQYVQDLLSTEGNGDKGLLIMPPENELKGSVSRVRLGAGDGAYKILLRVWLTVKQ